jgi:hypothetical protein
MTRMTELLVANESIPELAQQRLELLRQRPAKAGGVGLGYEDFSSLGSGGEANNLREHDLSRYD